MIGMYWEKNHLFTNVEKLRVSASIRTNILSLKSQWETSTVKFEKQSNSIGIIQREHVIDLSSDSYQVSSSLPEGGHSATYHDHLSIFLNTIRKLTIV